MAKVNWWNWACGSGTGPCRPLFLVYHTVAKLTHTIPNLEPQGHLFGHPVPSGEGELVELGLWKRKRAMQAIICSAPHSGEIDPDHSKLSGHRATFLDPKCPVATVN